MFVTWPVGYGIAATTGNLHLAAGSLCVNAGLDQAWMASASDIEGELRWAKGRVDMGAYEQPNPKGCVYAIR